MARSLHWVGDAVNIDILRSRIWRFGFTTGIGTVKNGITATPVQGYGEQRYLAFSSVNLSGLPPEQAV